MTDAQSRIGEVLVRAADAGDTYLTWRWLDDPAHVEFEVLPAPTTATATALLDSALLIRREGETGETAARHALTSGAFSDPSQELALSTTLADAVLPERLRRQLRERTACGVRVRFRVTPSRRLARVPWELLSVGPDVRLVEIADVLHDPPATVHAGRFRLPPAGGWHEVRQMPALYVIDPKLPPRAPTHLLPVLDEPDRRRFFDRLVDRVEHGRLLEQEQDFALQHDMDRFGFSAALRERPRSRLLYFGHVSSSPDEPGSASLHLYDTARMFGMAKPMRRPSPQGTARAESGDHLPLSALDLLVGNRFADERTWSAYGDRGPLDGPDLWPMPPRVALIACEGGADYRCAETFGLVIAILNAGAELVTTTRWPLPPDQGFRNVGSDSQPTTDLALRVDDAHEQDDPVGDLTRWQIRQLTEWRSRGSLAHSPLIWASLTHTFAPARAA